MVHPKRTGDAIRISGDYQYRALTEGSPVQRFWHESKQRAIVRRLPPLPKDFVLDVGCGSGVISHYLGSQGARVLGIDGNEEAIRFARETFSSPNVEFKQGLVDEVFACDAPPDKIYCLEVIEHIYFEQGREMLANFYRLLKPGGHLFLTTPNYRSLWPVIEWAMGRFSKAAPMDEAQHVAHFHRALLSNAIRQAGFDLASLSSFCCIAPWISPFHHGLAVALEKLEMSTPALPGVILIAVAQKKAC